MIDDETSAETGADDRKEVHPDGRVTLTLLYPATVQFKSSDGTHEEVISSLTFRRMTGSDLEKVGSIKGEFAQSVELLCLLAGIEKPVFRKLDMSDVLEAFDIIEGFQQGSRPTGVGSSPI